MGIPAHDERIFVTLQTLFLADQSQANLFYLTLHPCCHIRQVESESVVFNALIRWVNKNQAKRTSLFPSLFKHVRLQHVPADFLANTVRKEVRKSSGKFHATIKIYLTLE